MRALAVLMALAIVVPADLSSAQAGSPPAGLFEDDSASAPISPIDEKVLADLDALGIQPASLCTDSVFVRRVYLDVIGTLPTPAEVKRFLEDGDPSKRPVLIDRLLERDEFADYWALKWCDLLRVKSEFPINLWPNAVQAYHGWVRRSIKENRPYDAFVRDLLTANGSNFRVPQVNFFRAVRGYDPETIASAVALTFMGVRAENWPDGQLSAMAVFFEGIKHKRTGEWKEEIVFVDLLGRSDAAQPASATFPDGSRVDLPPNQDRLHIFTDWLLGTDNRWFARNVVNRIWYWLFGIGIIHEPDDIRPGNPAANPKLLALLEQELVTSRYDLKHIYRLILNSATYQRSCIPTTDRPEAERHFAHYPLRRLDAEVLIDAVCQITGTTESYSSLIPEPYTFIPMEQRSIALPDASITSAFLELFGRPPRDTGLESERNNTPTPAQKLHLLNSSHIRTKIESSRQQQTSNSKGRSRGPRRRSRRSSRHTSIGPTEIYLTVLSRYPTPAELTTINEYAAEAEAKGSEVLVDLTWALINTPEFLYRH